MNCPVFDWAQREPERLALKTPEGLYTYGEWNREIEHMVRALAQRGVEAGQQVALYGVAHRDYLNTLLALFRLGAVACPINAAFPATYRDERLAQLENTLLIADEAWGESMPTAVTFAALADGESSADMEPAASGWQLADAAAIIFTSGSTGTPKAAVLSLGNLYHNARLSNENIRLASGDNWLLSLPLHHVAGLGILFRSLIAGTTITIPAEQATLEESVARSGVTHYSLVARQLARLLDHPDSQTLLSGVKAILLGGSAIPPGLLERAHAQGLPLFTSYGMTEMATQATTTPAGADRQILVSSGRPPLEGALRINPDGIIEVNGPCRFLGYWSAGKIDRPFDSEGWFTTGDRGYIDDEGMLHVTGRIDNMFIAGGENVQPERIEAALCTLPGVRQAVVVPIPHESFGATPVAFLEGTEVDDGSCRSQLECLLPRHEIPGHFLPWPDGFAGGGMKIDRAAFQSEALRVLSEHESRSARHR